MNSKFLRHLKSRHRELSHESMMKFYNNAKYARKNQLYETCPICFKGTRDISRHVTYNHKDVNKKLFFSKHNLRKAFNKDKNQKSCMYSQQIMNFLHDLERKNDKTNIIRIKKNLQKWEVLLNKHNLALYDILKPKKQ